MYKVAFVLLMFFLVLSCSNKRTIQNNNDCSISSAIELPNNQNEEINNDGAEYPSTTETYFVYDFWNKPFLDYPFQPDYFGESINSLLRNETNTLVIREMKIENDVWTNGYYYKTCIENDFFETYYLSPYDKSSYRRPLLVIKGKGLKLKSSIYIGMTRNELLPLIRNNDQNSSVKYEESQIVVIIEEVWVYFKFTNDILETIEIQVGT